ncbi:MAG: tRNA lysidine(34) synthetase TilS [Firmicutes bacterium]|nr:tRNA lysidine(34) synthetase TilS [Bacillota bacterium]
MNDILNKMKKTIREQGLIEKGENVVAGFSGGPDSLCLLHGLYILKEELGIRTLTAVHVNHLYRGEAADRDEEFCRAYCGERGIPFRAERSDVEALAKEWKMSSEEAGRQVRYEAFARMAEELGGAKIAVAHNREDQGETLFLRIVRGTGTAGLCGMDYKREDGVIRPLLDCSRKDIEAFLEEEGLTPCIDHTNLEPVYNRNVVRLQVIPYINEKMGGDLTASLARLSEIAREDRDFIDGFVEKILEEIQCESIPSSAPSGHLPPRGKAGTLPGECRVSLPRKQLAGTHPAVMKRAIVRCFEKAGLPQDITSVHLEQAVKLLQSGSTTGETAFPHGFVMKCRYENVVFEKAAEEGGDLKMPGFTMSVLENPSSDLAALGHLPPGGKAGFDLDKIRAAGGEDNLVLRTRQPGDVISPKGFSGTKKLQNYFVDRKIDRDLRDKLPLLCLGQQVLWIPGYEINEKFRAAASSKRILLVELEESH